jgi:hypothetical protein
MPSLPNKPPLTESCLPIQRWHRRDGRCRSAIWSMLRSSLVHWTPRLTLHRTINGYCPHNVQPGWGSINLDKLFEHVKQENEEQERKNAERMQRRLAGEMENK